MAEYLKLEILNYDQFIRPLSGLIFKTSALPKKFNILFELFLPGATEVYMDKNSTKSHVANSVESNLTVIIVCLHLKKLK